MNEMGAIGTEEPRVASPQPERSGPDKGSPGWLAAFRGAAWAVGIGAVVGLLTVVYLALLLYMYRLITPEGLESSGASRGFATGTALEVFFIVACGAGGLLAGARAGHGGDGRTTSLGALTGLSATLVEQAMVGTVGGVLPGEFALFGTLGLAGGALGGWIGGREADSRAAGESAAFHGALAVARAEDADGIAAAIGKLLGAERVAGVGVWRSSPFATDAAASSGTWSPDGRFCAAEILDALPESETNGGAATGSRAVAPFDARGREIWKKQGVVSAFFGPLYSAGDEKLGYFVVAFRRMTLLGPGARRRIGAVTVAAGLALEKAERDRIIGVMEGTMTERLRLRREIHDRTVQELSAAEAHLVVAEEARERGEDKASEQRLGLALGRVRAAERESRRLIGTGTGGPLPEESLGTELALVVSRLAEEFGYQGHCRVVGTPRMVPLGTQHSLKRIADEALSNVRKYANPRRVDVEIHYFAERLKLVVADDGEGFDSAKVLARERAEGEGFGMETMRERTENLGGTLAVDSVAGKGTRIVVEVEC